MADKKEILMRIRDAGKGDLPAECQAALIGGAGADPLMKDFSPGCFFEIKNFSLSIGLQDKEASAAEQAHSKLEEHAQAEAKRSGKPYDPPKAAKQPRKFADWRDGGDAKYPLEVQPIMFSRIMDRASTALLQNLCQSKSYESATIVRRMGVGGDGVPRAYLRLDFTPVLVIGIDWDDQDLVNEKYKFICQKLTVQYSPQQSSGQLSPVVQGEWPNKQTASASSR